MRTRVNSLYLFALDSNRMYSRPSRTAISSLMHGAVSLPRMFSESRKYSGTSAPLKANEPCAAPDSAFSYTHMPESANPYEQESATPPSYTATPCTCSRTEIACTGADESIPPTPSPAA